MRSMYRSLRAFNMQFVPILKERGVEAARTAVSRVVFDSGIGDVVSRLYSVVGIQYATWTYNDIQRSALSGKKSTQPLGIKLIGSQINFNDRWRDAILNYFRLYLIDKAVVPITIQSKDRILEILTTGTNEGWSIERMAKELETDKMPMWRSRLIVRTETAKAAYVGRMLGKNDSGFETTKEWISAKDSRVRHSHRDMDGVIIDDVSLYNVPIYRRKTIIGYELMRGPGDPDASAENVCNCRCTEAYAAKRDTNGALIRKPISRVVVIQPRQINRPQTVTI